MMFPIAADQATPALEEQAALHSRLSLRANFAWTFLGNTVYAACQWGMLVVLAKLGTAEMVGKFALALAVTAPVLMFSNLQLRQLQATDARHDHPFGDYFALRLFTAILSLLTIGGLALAGGYGAETAAVVLVFGLAKAFEAISDVLYGLMQQHERMDRIAISMILKGVLSLAALGLGVYLTHSVLWGVLGLAAAWLVILAAYDLPRGRQLLAAVSTPYNWRPTSIAALRRLAWIALPLGLVMLLISLNTNIPRYFIEHFNGVRDLGIFAALSYLMTAGNTVVFALGQAATPRLARLHTAGDRAGFRTLTVKLLGLSSGLGLAGVAVALVAGPPLLRLLYSAEYAAHADAFVLIMVAAALWNMTSILGYAATAGRRIRHQATALVAIVATAGLAGLLLVPGMGLIGAALTMVASSALGVVAYGLLLLAPPDKAPPR